MAPTKWIPVLSLATALATPVAYADPDAAHRDVATALVAKAEAIYQPTDDTYGADCLVDALIRLGRLDDATKLTDRLGGTSGSIALEHLAVARLRAGDRAGAAAAVAKVKVVDGPAADWVKTYLLAARGDFAEAEDAARVRRLPWERSQMLAQVAAVEFEVGRHERADKAFQEADDILTAAALGDFQTPGELALDRSNCGDFTGARKTLAADQNPADVTEYGVRIMVGHYQDADHDLLAALLPKYEAAFKPYAGTTTEPTDKSDQDSARLRMLETVVEGWAAVGDPDRAKRTASQMAAIARQDGNARLLARAGAGMFKAGDAPAADKLFQEATDAASTKTGKDAVDGLLAVAVAEAATDQWPAAVALLEKVSQTKAGADELNFTYSSYSAGNFADLMARKNGTKVDWSWIEKMPTDRIKADAYARAADGLLRGDQ